MRSHATTEVGCVLIIYIVLLGFIAGAIPKIRQAADWIKAEREAQKPAAPDSEGSEKQ
jgi:hypothetical protein